jgi:gamma-glutamylaminecyclotransferase
MSRRREHLVFTYGTLLKGEVNHHLLAQARFVAEARTESCFELFDIGPFPAMSTGGETAVLGEVYAVDDATLARLDHLEGHPRFYQRTRIRLDGGQEVQTYLMARTRMHGRVIITSGDWRAHRARAGGIGGFLDEP